MKAIAYIKSINQEWRKLVPPFLSTSHCEFYGACCTTTHDKPSIRPFNRELVPSLFEESMTRTKFIEIGAAILLIQPYIKYFLSPQKFLRCRHFFFVFRGLVGACVNPGSFFKISFCTFTCSSNNSLISSWISAKFVSALLPCMFYLSHYFQLEVNT